MTTGAAARWLRAAVFAAVLAAGPAGAAERVHAVKVRGEEGAPVDEASVLSFTKVRAGEELDRAGLARDLRELEKSGRFSRVRADLEKAGEDVDVVFVVNPRLRIRSLRIEGALEIGNKKIRDLLELGVGDLFDDGVMGAKLQKVRDYYLKHYYPFAQVTWTNLPDVAAGTVDLTVDVKEGKRAKIHDIVFAGTQHVPVKDLQKAMTQKKSSIWSWLTGSGTLTPDLMDSDREAVRKAYLDRGYLEVQVGAPEIVPHGERQADLRLAVAEGRVFHLTGTAIEGNTIFPLAVLQVLVTNRPGDVASVAALDATAQAIRDYYGSRGYVNTRVDPVSTPDNAAATVSVVFRIREGKLAYLRNIYIRGNTKTKDKVIRREISAFPGEVYNEVKIRSSERRLRNLGYFERVTAQPSETIDPEKLDLQVEVEEKRSGQVTFGVGFSSTESLLGFVELQQNNFDISQWPPVGAGQKLRLRGTVGTERQDVDVGFTEPWFLDRKLSLSANAFHHDRQYYSSDYDQRNTGFDVGLGKPISTFDRINLIYGFQVIDIYNVDENASETIKEEEGTRDKSALTLEYVHDTRNNPFIPSRGNRTELSSSYAGGPLGGETDIYGLEGQSSQFVPLWFDHVLTLRGWVSVVDTHDGATRVPIFDRLFLGGTRTMRGFKFRDVSPKDENGESVGGQSGWYATVEYTVPVVELVRAAVYYDIGMIYPDSYDFPLSEYNSDVGIGLRIDIPGFPLRFDYAWPIEADEFNDRSGGLFQFSIGYGL
jgi:outer membrane protein insertion porin family